jgi:hypothetical protein
MQKQQQELLDRPIVLGPVGRHESKADEPIEVVQIVEENFSTVLAGNIGPAVIEVGEGVEGLAERLEESDGFVVAKKSGNFCAKFVNVKDEAVGQRHVFDGLGQQSQNRD